VTIEKGSPYGQPGALPDDGVVVGSDAEARRVLEAARREHRPFAALGLLGGDLWRTLGGTNADAARLRSADAVTFTVDLGEVLLDGALHLFVAHLVARNRTWTRVLAAMNAQWLSHRMGSWNAGPRAHPNDGLLDIYDADLSLGQLLPVRSRLVRGAHLPHPGIREQRAAAVHLELPRPLPVWLDGDRLRPATRLSIRVEPDAVRVVVA
jgi:hypothetical protein